MDFSAINERIPLPDGAAMRAAQARWNAIAKPVGSLGLLEDALVRIAGITGSARISLDRRAVVVFCADNGVVEEGVTQTGQEVTALVAGNMARGETSVCCMARAARADVFPVDMGMRTPAPGVRELRVAPGTGSIARGPAMTRAQAEQALEAGIGLAGELRAQGYDILATGEMGIGNTTTASAMAAVLCGMKAEQATGRGAGLSDAGLSRKVAAIRRAIEINRPDASDALDVLHKLGGFDIAGMAGLFIGGALHRVPVLIDGSISAVAALTAARLCPRCTAAMLATHASAEPAAALLLSALGLEAPIHAHLRLGEGTGAMCALPLFDLALSVYDGMVSFTAIGMEPYEVHPQ